MKWTAFVDETGDHGLEKIDPASPLFALTAIVYQTDAYLTGELLSVARMKQRFWGHEGAILHSYDISKKQGFFSFCVDPVKRQDLFDAITQVFENSPGKIISAVIDKAPFKGQYKDPTDCYKLACEFVLERIFLMTGGDVRIIFESRGRTEDNTVEGWCKGIADGGNATRKAFRCEIRFAKKAWNVAGLQMADLACQPITHYVNSPDSKRPDWLAVRANLRTNRNTGSFMGYGLKVFPRMPKKAEGTG